jgi:uncharacterized protein (UPF0297 family)
MSHTKKFNFDRDPYETLVTKIFSEVYNALEESGHHPINQISGYLLSGDPSYIPRHKEARNVVKQIEREELLEELVRAYIIKHS